MCIICCKEDCKVHLSLDEESKLFVLASKSKEKFGDVFDFSDAYEKKIESSRDKFLIKCLSCSGTTETYFRTHLDSKNGCRLCAGNYKTTEEWLKYGVYPIHGDLYGYEKVVYKGAKKNVTLWCKTCSKYFEKQAYLFVSKKSGCNHTVQSLEEFISKAEKTHGKRYDYSRSVYVNAKTKVIIGCSKHGDFLQTPNNHYSFGCQKCGMDDIREKLRLGTALFIEKARKVHGDRYDYSLVDYKKQDVYVTIGCPIHTFFKQSPECHLQGHGCTMCTNTKIQYEQWLSYCMKKFQHKFDYSQVSFDSGNEEILLSCKLHGSFETTPKEHFQSETGCTICDKKRKLQEYIKHNTERFIERSKALFGNLYTYNETKYLTAIDYVSITCSKHGAFLVKPHKHFTEKIGCIECGRNYKWDFEFFLYLANRYHNNVYDYSEVKYKTLHTEVFPRCDKHGKFRVIPREHLFMRKGCPECQKCPKCDTFTINGKLCVHCDDTYSLFFKRKETSVVKELQKRISKPFLWGESVGSDVTGTHLYPDIRFDCLTYQVIVEIDEHKHSGRKKERERMHNIANKLKTPCLFIRYNPDSKKANIEHLVCEIEKALETEPKFRDCIETVYLFYES